MKALKAPQKSENTKFNLIYISTQLSEMHGSLRVEYPIWDKCLIRVYKKKEKKKKQLACFTNETDTERYIPGSFINYAASSTLD